MSTPRKWPFKELKRRKPLIFHVQLPEREETGVDIQNIMLTDLPTTHLQSEYRRARMKTK